MYISVLVYHFIFCEQKDQILCKHVLGLHTTTHVNRWNSIKTGIAAITYTIRALGPMSVVLPSVSAICSAMR